MNLSVPIHGPLVVTLPPVTAPCRTKVRLTKVLTTQIQKKNKSRHSNNSGLNNSANNSAKTSADTTIKLGKDGKLLPEERQRRIDQGLCLLCGQKGHLVKECPKATSNMSNSSNSKGRAAKASDSKAEATASTSDSKK